MRKSHTSEPPKPYWEMNLEELREATREFDADFVPTSPLTPKMRADLRRARAHARAKRGRGRGRPKVGGGAKSVLVSVEQGLLKQADAFAKAHAMSRSQLVAEGLRRIMAAAL